MSNQIVVQTERLANRGAGIAGTCTEKRTKTDGNGKYNQFLLRSGTNLQHDKWSRGNGRRSGGNRKETS